jgi:hypothetical protein
VSKGDLSKVGCLELQILAVTCECSLERTQVHVESLPGGCG